MELKNLYNWEVTKLMAIWRLLCSSAPSGVSVSVLKLVCMPCLSFQVSDFRNGVFFSLEFSLVLLIGCNWLLPDAGQGLCRWRPCPGWLDTALPRVPGAGDIRCERNQRWQRALLHLLAEETGLLHRSASVL